LLGQAVIDGGFAETPVPAHLHDASRVATASGALHCTLCRRGNSQRPCWCCVSFTPLRVLSEAPPQAPLPRSSTGSSVPPHVCNSTRDTREAVVDVLDARPPPSTCVRVETVNRRRVIADAPHSRSFNGMSRANTFIRSMLLEPVTVGVIVSGPGFFMLSPDEAWV